MRNTLIDLVRGAEHQSDALYRLKVTVKQTIEGTAVETNGDITRYTYTMVADYALSNIHTGADITTGSETSVTGYDVVASPYATLVAQQDAQKNAAKDVADRIRIDLASGHEHAASTNDRQAGLKAALASRGCRPISSQSCFMGRTRGWCASAPRKS